PQTGKNDERRAEHLAAAAAAFFRLFLRPAVAVEGGLDRWAVGGQLERLGFVGRGGQRGGGAQRRTVWAWVHGNGQFTIFNASRKRLERKRRIRGGKDTAMALGAVIGAYQEDDSGGLRALLPLAGRTLLEYQVRCAAAAGAAPVVVVVGRVPQALQAEVG